MKRKRWGKKHEDKRDWKAYNEKLVKRGEFYINPRFLNTWLDELEEMNAGKVGQPYLYPESMIEFLSVLDAKGFDDRSLEGIMRGLSKNFGNFPVISYSQINRRINQLGLDFENYNCENLVVGIDGSGIKVSNRGEWMRQKWGVRRGWIKVVIMGTSDGKTIDVRVGSEELDEKAAGRGMLRKNKKKIKKAIFDGLHDCEDTFNLCEKLGIESAIKIRENASEKGLGSRPKEVRLYKGIGYKKWAEQKQYGLRWPSTEGIFSAVKRIFGEHVNSHKKRNAYHEAKLKFWAYQQLQQNI